MVKSQVQDTLTWFSKNHEHFKECAWKIEDLINDILDIEKINYQTVQSRVKSIQSFEEKIKTGSYVDPKLIQDIVGIRVICYVESDIKKIQKILKENFKIDKNKLTDKSKRLGIDKVGYRSTHIIAKLSAKRNNLPEYRRIKNIHFEIQITTVLQHAWAEFGHDRNYKFTGTLPKELERRMNLHAGTLENIDKDFDSISKELEKYSKEVKSKTEKGELEIPIDSTSLKQYLDKTYSGIETMPNFSMPDQSSKLISELNLMGIKTLKDLDKITPKNFKSTLENIEVSELNYLSVVRLILTIYDRDKYLKDARENHWDVFEKPYEEVLKKFDIDIVTLGKKYGLKFVEELRNKGYKKS